jgi:MraZ protein
MGGFKDQVIFYGTGLTFCLWDPQVLLETTAAIPVDKDEVRRLVDELGKKK